jgi:hypothetical protein
VRHVKELDNMRHTLRQMKKADMRQIMRQINKIARKSDKKTDEGDKS